MSYGMLRQFSTDAHVIAQLQRLPEPEIFFNYLGRQGSGGPTWLRPARESSGPAHGATQSRLRLLNCKTLIGNGQLIMNWGYSENIHKKASIEWLAELYLDELRALLSSL